MRCAEGFDVTTALRILQRINPSLLGLLGLKLMIRLQQIHLFQVLNKVWFKIDYSLTMEMHFVWLLKLWRKNKTNVLQWQNFPLSPFLASNFFSIQVKHRPCRCLQLQRTLLLQRTQSPNVLSWFLLPPACWLPSNIFLRPCRLLSHRRLTAKHPPVNTKIDKQ